MQIAQLILDYINVLVWPAVVGTGLVIFRGRLRELLGRVTRAEGAGFAAQFSDLQHQVKQENLEESAETPAPTPVPQRPARQAYTRVRIAELTDLIQVWQLLKAFDSVDLQLSTLSRESRISVGMWVLGLLEGEHRLKQDSFIDDVDDPHIVIYWPEAGTTA